MFDLTSYLGDIISGAVLALPSLLVSSLRLRIWVAFGLPMFLYALLLMMAAHAGFSWNGFVAARLLFGALIIFLVGSRRNKRDGRPS